MNDEDLLKGLFTDIAGRAHDPAMLAPVIVARARVHRQRRGLLVAAGAAGTTAAVGGTGVAAWLARRNGAPAVVASPSVTPTPSPVVTPAPSKAPEGLRVPMRFKPGWLPKGYVEVSRHAGVSGQTRSYQRSHPESLELIHLFLDRAKKRPKGAETAVLGGRKAWFTGQPDNHTQVLLDVGGGMELAVAVVPEKDRLAIAKRIAAAITAEPSAVCEVSMSFGWLPSRVLGEPEAGLDGSPNSWTESLRLYYEPRMRLTLEAGIAPKAPVLKGGRKTTLRGRPARLYPGNVPDPDCPPSTEDQQIICGESMAMVVVDLGGGRELTLQSLATRDLSLDEMRRIVEDMHIGPAPDTSWLPRW